MKAFFSIIILTLLVSCDESFRSDEIIGVYVPIGYKNSYDTIWIRPDSLYSRKVYNAENKIVLTTTQKYVFINNNIIDFFYFFENYDYDLALYPENLSDTLGGMQCRLERYKGEVRFCIDLSSESRRYWYKKID